MARRICWKRGMRLTDVILRASDENNVMMVGKALGLAAGGRFGLLPSSLRPFELTLNIMNGYVDVESLKCLALTKDGQLIDVKYDTRFTNFYDTRVKIPDDIKDEELFLAVIASTEEWKEVNDGFEESVYSFSLYGSNSLIPDDAMPIAKIVKHKQYGWHQDEVDFVPPCLFLSSHPKFEGQLQQFSSALSAMDQKIRETVAAGANEAIRILWPITQQLMIETSKECDLMTPMMLLSNVQKCVSAFVCACSMDSSLELENAGQLWDYVAAPYNFKDVYRKIQEGISVCLSISEQVELLKAEKEVKHERVVHKEPSYLEAPYIENDQLFQNCKTQSASVKVVTPVPDAIVFYSIDGSEPSRKLPVTGKITFENGFNKKRMREPDKIITVKLRAELDDVLSELSTFKITVHKNIEEWQGWTI